MYPLKNGDIVTARVQTSANGVLQYISPVMGVIDVKPFHPADCPWVKRFTAAGEHSSPQDSGTLSGGFKPRPVSRYGWCLLQPLSYLPLRKLFKPLLQLRLWLEQWKPLRINNPDSEKRWITGRAWFLSWADSKPEIRIVLILPAKAGTYTNETNEATLKADAAYGTVDDELETMEGMGATPVSFSDNGYLVGDILMEHDQLE